VLRADRVSFLGGSAMAYLLAIDQSTSATKAVLFDTLGKMLDKSSLEHRQLYPQPGYLEHDAAEIWSNTVQVVKTLVERNRAKTGDVVALSITNQRETFVVFDRRTGEPLRNAIVWQCRRGEDTCNELTRGGHEDVVRRKTGLRIDTYFSAPKLAWLMRNEPELARRVRSGEALVG